MMAPEEMQQRRRELGLTYQEISDRCGVPVSTVQKIIMGETANPRTYNRAMVESVLSAVYVRETAFKEDFRYKKQGEYTIDDYYALPDDERGELIDGVIYYMGAPTIKHQDYMGELFYQLKTYVKNNNGPCRPYASPVDVKLDDCTMVQPDVMILCDENKDDMKRINGAPDFIAEFTSPSTRSRDFILKLSKYASSGVREYWIVDLKTDTVTVYNFTAEDLQMQTYKIDEDIPVAIWDGMCKVNLSEPFEYYKNKK